MAGGEGKRTPPDANKQWSGAEKREAAVVESDALVTTTRSVQCQSLVWRLRTIERDMDA
jgi:hypothetical protein